MIAHHSGGTPFTRFSATWMDAYHCESLSLYAVVYPFNINTLASGQRSCFLSPLCSRRENRYPFSQCLSVCASPTSPQCRIPATCNQHHIVLASARVCLRKSGGRLIDPHFRLWASTLCSTWRAPRQPCTWTKNVDGKWGGGWGEDLEKGQQDKALTEHLCFLWK